MTQENYQDNRREITLKELLLKVKEYFIVALKGFWLIALIMLPFIAYNAWVANETVPTYSDKLTFMVNSEDGNSMSSVASILGQIGLGGGGKTRMNYDKILELSKTREIIGRVLFDSIEIDGQKDLLINQFIGAYEWDEDWAENTPELKGFRFKNNKISELSLMEGRLFKNIHMIIVGNAQNDVPGFLSSSFSNETGIMEFNATTKKEMLTYHLLNTVFEKLSEFYVNKTIEKQKTTFDLVSAKRDSLYGALQSAEYSFANFRESNRNLIDSRAKLSEIRLKRDIAVLTQAYAEAVKNTEISDFTLKNTIPFVQIIDQPLLPLKEYKPSVIRAAIKGAILGFILGLLFVLGRKLIRDAFE